MNAHATMMLLGDEGATERLGAAVARALEPGDVVALHGELGAGKTRLVRAVARALGMDERRVSSPTFVLVNIYEAPAGSSAAQRGIAALVHCDAYRLSGPDELPEMGVDRLITPDQITAIEWAERIESALPAVGEAGRWDIRLEHAGETIRRATVTAPAGRRVALSARPCPICGGAVDAESRAAPFCSERCRLADLGKWFGGAYRISRPVEQRDLEEG